MPADEVPGSGPSEQVPPLGTCFGFQVHSASRFLYLRGGRGDPLQVLDHSDGEVAPAGKPSLEWTPTPTRPWHIRLYAEEDQYRLWIAGGGWFRIDADNRTIYLPDSGDMAVREQRLWGIPTMLCFLHRGDVPLHAAAVQVDRAAVILAAPGTFGKSTLAAAFFQAGYRVLSEDLTCLRLADAPAVIPGPPMLRLRHDMAQTLELPGTRCVTTVGGRDHLSLLPGRGDCEPVPLRAIVLLRNSDEGPRLERIPAAQTVRDLWALSFRLPTDAHRARCFRAVADLARSVPVWNLSRALRVEALASTVERIATDV